MLYKGRISEGKQYLLNGVRRVEGSNLETVIETTGAGDTAGVTVEREGNTKAEGVHLMGGRAGRILETGM